MNPPNSETDSLDSGVLVSSFIIGLLIGGVFALFRAPNKGVIRQQLTETGGNLRQKIEAAVPSDPIAESLAEGKAAARRRRAELGLQTP
ncbi:MAG: YtxH domain-containing protein [Chloroflexota bacterium]